MFKFMMLLNRRSLFIALTIAATILPPAIAVSAPTTTSPVPEFSYSRMGMGGIKLGTKAAEVQRKLGKPLQVKSQDSRCCGVLLYWKYEDLEVKLEVPSGRNQELNASVYSISTRSAKVTTLEGVRVGDQRSKVIRTYGNPSTDEKTANEKTANSIFYYSNKYASRLTFRFQNDRVVEISAATQLN